MMSPTFKPAFSAALASTTSVILAPSAVFSVVTPKKVLLVSFPCLKDFAKSSPSKLNE